MGMLGIYNLNHLNLKYLIGSVCQQCRASLRYRAVNVGAVDTARCTTKAGIVRIRATGSVFLNLKNCQASARSR